MANLEIISLTKEGIPELAAQVTDNLAPLGFPQTARQNLEDFMTALHQEQAVATIALVSEPNAYPGERRLDFYVLWDHPTNLDRQDSRDRERTVSTHAHKFASPLDKMGADEQYYETFFYVIDPRSHPSPESFRDSLVGKYGAGWSAGVIAVANFVRP